MRGTAERLAGALAELPVTISAADVRRGAVSLPSYPGGARPHAVVTLTGDGVSGHGEHVGWTRDIHERFAARVSTLPRGRMALKDFRDRLLAHALDPFDRAALEAAAIDLALRQHDTSPSRLIGARPSPLRYVVSFDAATSPAAALVAHPSGDLKLDVDPHWSDDMLAALAATGRVAVLDWKRSGTRAAHERAHRLCPATLQEDPGELTAGAYSASLRARVSVDAALACAADLDRLPFPPAAANVKPARLGGVFEALHLAARLDTAGIPFYLGGMFEVGIGRRQLHVLAAILCPDEPNDVAPLAVGESVPPRPARLTVDPTAIGFGSSPA